MPNSTKTQLPQHLGNFANLIRVKQWIKNAFVFAALIFSKQFLDPAAIQATVIVFSYFCVAAATTYILNDLIDYESDRLHPKKSKSRPIAAGKISKKTAKYYFGLGVVILFTSFCYRPEIAWVLFGYLAWNIAYSYYFKSQPVLDIFAIAVSFVLRVVAGALAISAPLSSWMFITTMCLALYLAAIKRRQELALVGAQSRKVLTSYTVSLVEKYAQIAATGALVFYSIFVVTTHENLVLTIPLVLFGIYRYWYLVECLDDGESPTEALVGDLQLFVCVTLWVAACVWALWPN